MKFCGARGTRKTVGRMDLGFGPWSQDNRQGTQTEEFRSNARMQQDPLVMVAAGMQETQGEIDGHA
jgi:hypothetical protein